MNKSDIELLYRYNDWANAAILRQAAQVTADVYEDCADVPAGSLHDTLVHTQAAEVAWRRRWQGDSPTALLSATDLPTFAALAARWAQEAQALRQFVANPPPSSPVAATTRFTMLPGTSWRAA